MLPWQLVEIQYVESCYICIFYLSSLYILFELKFILFQVTKVLVNYSNPHIAQTDPHALLLLLQL